MVKNAPANVGNAGDTGSIPGSLRSLEGEYGNLFQRSCLRNPMDRGASAGYSLWSHKESDMIE